MAWQNPKTNWAAADGVRNTDFNRIEGNIQELYTGDAVRSDTTIYVTTGGNDSSGTGTSAAPYRTMTKALSTIPKNINGMNVTINVGAGTYSEAVVVKDFNGIITITGASNAIVIVNSFTVLSCTCVLNAIRLTMTGAGVTVDYGGNLVGTGLLDITSAPTSITVNNASSIALNTLVSTTAANYVARIDNCSRVDFTIMSGDENYDGLIVQGGSILSYTSNSLDILADVFHTYSGGRIYTGSQNTSTYATAVVE